MPGMIFASCSFSLPPKLRNCAGMFHTSKPLLTRIAHPTLRWGHSIYADFCHWWLEDQKGSVGKPRACDWEARENGKTKGITLDIAKMINFHWKYLVYLDINWGRPWKVSSERNSHAHSLANLGSCAVMSGTTCDFRISLNFGSQNFQNGSCNHGPLRSGWTKTHLFQNKKYHGEPWKKQTINKQ